MCISPINANMYNNNPYYQLMNMESMLGYCGMPNVPSMYNNYCMSSDSFNGLGYNPNLYNQYSYPSLYGNNTYSGYNPSFCGAAQNIQNQNQNNVSFGCLSQEEVKALSDYYSKSINAEEGFGGAIVGAIPFAMMENPQTVAHPINAFKAARESGKMMEGWIQKYGLDALKKDNPAVFEGAYKQLYRVSRNAKWKLPISRWFVGQTTEAEYKKLVEILEKAMATKDPETIRIATEQLRAASANNGRLPRLWKWIKGNITGSETKLKRPDVLAEEALSSGAAKEAAEKASNGFIKNLTLKGASMNGAMMIAFEAFGDKDKIGAAFRQDSKTGFTQIGQTAVKGITTAAGMSIGGAVGKAAGTWAGALAGAKVGALVGSAVPGLGTAVGAVVGTLIGFAGMSVGMWLGGKIGKGIVGKDVGQTALDKEMASTHNGQIQLIQFAYEKQQAGEKLDSKTQQALNHAISLYA